MSAKPHRTLDDFPGDVLRVEEAAEVLRMSRNTCYDAIQRGEVPAIRIGHRLLVPKLALRRLFSGETEPAKPESRGDERARLLRIAP